MVRAGDNGTTSAARMTFASTKTRGRGGLGTALRWLVRGRAVKLLVELAASGVLIGQQLLGRHAGRRELGLELLGQGQELIDVRRQHQVTSDLNHGEVLPRSDI